MARGLADSRGHASELIAAGSVTVGGAPALKSSRQVSSAESIVVAGPPPPFVGRGGLKLAYALAEFDIDPGAKHALDVGSSTGGFTDCLLQSGAASVVAVDVGTHQLHERLRGDDRVSSWEQTDIREIEQANFADDPLRRHGFGLIVVDLSFISTSKLLGHLAGFLRAEGDLVALIKPQFEAGRTAADRGGGVIRDPSVWKSVLHDFIDRAFDAGLQVDDLALSPILGGKGRGGKGNVEFLGHLVRASAGGGSPSSIYPAAP